MQKENETKKVRRKGGKSVCPVPHGKNSAKHVFVECHMAGTRHTCDLPSGVLLLVFSSWDLTGRVCLVSDEMYSANNP